MRFPKFWQQASNQTRSVVAWGWSENSAEEAQQNAQARFQRMMTAFKTDQTEHLRNDYQYVIDNLIREFVVERIGDHQGHETAVISRNGYGSLILNTPQMIMIDLDIPQPTPSVSGFFGRLFGGASQQKSPADQILKRLTDWQRANSEFSFRIYRTAAGLRAIVINQIADGVSPQLMKMMNDLESDPLYRELCRSQGCFRSRLTPKPWRIGLKSPGVKFPFVDAEAEHQFDTWFSQYSARAQRYKVCQVVTTIGTPEIHPQIAHLLDLHDSFCCDEKNLPLA